MDNGIHPSLVGLLRELPKPGEMFPADKKDLFLIAFEKCLDVVYPDQGRAKENDDINT